MLWLDTNENMAEEAARRNAWKLENIQKLKAFRDIGEKFIYLGVELIVTAHTQYEDGVGLVPAICADYINQRREIVEATFPISKLPCLIAENENGE